MPNLTFERSGGETVVKLLVTDGAEGKPLSHFGVFCYVNEGQQ